MSAPLEPGARPKLASKARLRFDRHTGQHMLIYPERGMQLNPSAAAIAQLCTGEYSVAEIVERLSAADSGTPREKIENDVATFLATLLDRALLVLC